MKIQMRNPKLLTQIPGELEHAIKCRCNQSFTLYNIANTLQDVRKKKNIGKKSVYRANSFNKTHPCRLENKDKPKEKNSRCDQEEEHFSRLWINRPLYHKVSKAKKDIYSFEKVPEEEAQEEDSESEFMGNSIREISDDDQDPIEEFLVEYQEETQL
ncbi:hypothetical protein O181_036459 [Austropuccinia psidii MF-1]|uniref:Uncharacterized protein n=1 Tax=Austropuccinia psidii MF-1 TaxID=1389203 RepID=A0A9Q3D4L5_9BASI|nr:hypothetical protein [Austropuccinia psidii MF-1]